MSIRWTVRAWKDLESISKYLRLKAPEAESQVVMKIYEAVGSLVSRPLMGRPTTRKGVRQLVLVDIQYIVTYRVVPAAVQVLRIRHGARKPLKDQM